MNPAPLPLINNGSRHAGREHLSAPPQQFIYLEEPANEEHGNERTDYDPLCHGSSTFHPANPDPRSNWPVHPESASQPALRASSMCHVALIPLHLVPGVAGFTLHSGLRHHRSGESQHTTHTRICDPRTSRRVWLTDRELDRRCRASVRRDSWWRGIWQRHRQ